MMGHMTGRQRALAWGGVTAGALLAIGLVALVAIADLEMAGQVAGIVGLGFSVYALRRSAAPVPPAPTAPVGPAVTAGAHRSVAIGGSVSGSVSTCDGPAPAPAHPRHGAASPAPPTASPPTPTAPPATVHAAGEPSVAIGGDVSGIVSTGDATPAGPATATPAGTTATPSAGPHTSPGAGHPGDSDR